jgi:redox-sensing transcriptional repressor
MTTVTDDHRLSTGLGDESSPSVVVTRSVFFMAERPRRRIPDATGISSEQLAELAAVNAAKVRKDLSYLGSYGTRGIGYEVRYLVFQIERELGLNHEWPVVIVGAGNLGQALSGYGGFGQKGFPVAGVVDIDPAKIGGVVGGVRVRHIDELAQVVAARQVSIGVVAVPAEAAQDAAERLVKAGITSILNFSPVVLTLPFGIMVRTVDLALELQILSYHEQQRQTRQAAIIASKSASA